MLHHLEIQEDGVLLAYELLGDTSPHKPSPLLIVFTPGGQTGRDAARKTAQAVVEEAKRRGLSCCAVIWDRRNMGLSSVAFTGAALLTEEADDLGRLVDHLKSQLYPAADVFHFGISSGARVGLVLAIRRPHLFRGQVMMPPTGGTFAAEQLSRAYYTQYIVPVEQGGMGAVADSAYWKKLLVAHAEDPLAAPLRAYHASSGGSQGRMLAVPVERFVRTMQASAAVLDETGKEPLLGATEDDLRSLGLPTLVMHHGDERDKLHARANAKRAAAALKDAEYLELNRFKGFAAATMQFVSAKRKGKGGGGRGRARL